MESQDSMEQQGAAQAGLAAAAAVGVTLREARERMGMSVEEVAGRLKFAPRQVAALEAGDFAQLPEMAFVRGFVRSYARLVQLEEKALLDALPGAPAPAAIQVRSAGGEVPRQGADGMRQNFFWIGAALFVVVLGIIAWKYDAGETKSASGNAAETAQTSAAPQAVPAQPVETQQAGEGAQPAQAGQPGQAAQPETTPVTEGAAQAGATGAGGHAAPAPAAAATEAAPAAPAVHPAPAARAPSGAAAQAAATAHGDEKKPVRAPAHGAASAASGVAPAVVAHAKPRLAPPTASGVPATGEAAPQASGPSRLVRLEFTEDSWVEVRDGNGKILLSMLGKQGTSRSASGPTPLSVVVGNARGVKLVYKGQAVPLQPMAGSEVARLTLE